MTAAANRDSHIKPCAVVPTYNNPSTLRTVVLAVREYLPDVIVVNDGSGEENSDVCRALEVDGLAHVHWRGQNGGKGAAVKDGLRAADKLGYTHVLQIDADHQHETDDIPKFLQAAEDEPDALILGSPVFDSSAPWIRLMGRRITRFWVHVQTGGRVITDPMCGFRMYPLARALLARVRGNAMDFDPEIAVRMHWLGTPIRNLPTKVRYNDAGVSHFRQVRDNALIAWMHVRLCTAAVFRLIGIGNRPVPPGAAR